MSDYLKVWCDECEETGKVDVLSKGFFGIAFIKQIECEDCLGVGYTLVSKAKFKNWIGSAKPPITNAPSGGIPVTQI